MTTGGHRLGAAFTLEGTRRVSLAREVFPLRGVFRIARGASVVVELVVATISEGGVTGRGEGVPYRRYGETVESVLAQAEPVAAAIAAGLGRLALQERLAPGAARNALDCALWDLEARLEGRAVWQLAGLPRPGPLETAFTLSLDSPSIMEAAARDNATRPLLKVKLGGGEGDLERLRAVRRGAPGARLIVDANEGWSLGDYLELAPALADLGVELIEQPLPAGREEALDGAPRPVPLCADEACHDRASLPGLVGRYDMINVKLDKTGGLTEAIALRDEALALGFGLMVGCMVSTSLSMAPAVLLAQGAQVIDLDGPLLLARDRPAGLRYRGSSLSPPSPDLWGGDYT